MNKSIQFITCFLFATAIFFSGCATTADGRLAQGQGAAIGAGVGALLGAGLGYAIGGQRGAVAGAAIGGLAGSGVGFAYGSHVAGKKQQYASVESYLDACIAAAQERNEEAIAYNRSLRQKIAQLESRASSALASGDKAAIRTIRNEIESLQGETKGQIKAIDKEITIQQKVIQTEQSTSSVGGLRSQVSQLQATRASSERELSRLASLDNRLDA